MLQALYNHQVNQLPDKSPPKFNIIILNVHDTYNLGLKLPKFGLARVHPLWKRVQLQFSKCFQICCSTGANTALGQKGRQTGDSDCEKVLRKKFVVSSPQVSLPWWLQMARCLLSIQLALGSGFYSDG